ncbi:hypothetical protein JCM5350_007151 [Sporobolomyces pararoseus]
MIQAPSFSTSRLVFRSVEPADYAAPDGFLHKLLNSEQVQHGLTANSVLPMSKRKIDRWFERFDRDAIGFQGVFCLRNEDAEVQSSRELEPVGWCSLDEISSLHRKTTFGLVIAGKYQGKGYSKEAMEWLLERAFNGFGLNKVEGEVFAWNERALKCYKSVGFVEEGRRRQTVWQNGAFRDDYFIGILASEWRERHEKTSETSQPV